MEPHRHLENAPRGIRFPRLVARSLTGVDIELPVGFPGRLVVAILAFRQNQQRLVDTWADRLDELTHRHRHLRWFELPALGRQWAPLRPFIDGGMARGIADERVCARTLTIYGDLQRICVPLGITDRSTITVVLTDRSGAVHWRATGGCRPDTASDLESVVEELSARGG